MKQLMLFLLLCSFPFNGQALTLSQQDSIITIHVENHLKRIIGDKLVNDNIIITVCQISPGSCAMCEVKTNTGIQLNEEGRNTFAVKLIHLDVDTLHTFIDKKEIDKCVAGENCKLLIGKAKAIEKANQLNLLKGKIPWIVGVTFFKNEYQWYVSATTNIQKSKTGKDLGGEGELVSIDMLTGTAYKGKWLSVNY